MPDRTLTVGAEAPASDAWTRATADLTPEQYQSFVSFVAGIDPDARTSDEGRLHALRMTWAFHHDATGYPRHARREGRFAWPWKLFLVVVFTIGVGISSTQPSYQAYGWGQRREVPRSVAELCVSFGLLGFLNLLVLAWND